MSETPSVSVILPFYNAEKHIKKAIESIQSQSFRDFELLLVDNASSDHSREIALALAEQDQRIRLIPEHHKGIVSALNTGLRLAQGKYIARMDADDISLPERLGKQYQFLENNPDTQLVSCKVSYKSKEQNQETRACQEYINWTNQLVNPEEISLNRFVESPVCHASVMVRREAFQQWGGYKDGDFPEDYELWLRWLGQGVKMAKIPEHLFIWNDSQERLSRVDARYGIEACYKIKSIYLERWLKEHNPLYPQVAIWGAAHLSRQRANLLENRGIEVTTFIDVVRNKIQFRNCLHYSELPPPQQMFIISYVSNHGVREKIRNFLKSKAYIESQHFILAA